MTLLLRNLSAKQLRRAAGIREKIESLQGELNQMLGGFGPAAPAGRGRKRRISAAGRARIAAAARARWAGIKGSASAPKRKQKRSRAWRAKLAAAARARWRRAKALGRTRL